MPVSRISAHVPFAPLSLSADAGPHLSRRPEGTGMPFARRCRPVSLAALAAATAATLQAPAAHAAPATEAPVTGATAGDVATAETGGTTRTTRSRPPTTDTAARPLAPAPAPPP